MMMQFLKNLRLKAFKKDKFKYLGLGITLLILLFIAITLYTVKQKQNVSKKAFDSSGIIEILLNPLSTSFQRKETLAVSVNLRNNGTSPRQIAVAGVDLAFDQKVFIASNASCNSIFPSPVRVQIDNTGKINLTCAINGGSGAIVLNAGETKTLGVFNLTVRDTAPYGNTRIRISRGVIPDYLTDMDISYQAKSEFKYIIKPSQTIKSAPTGNPVR